MKFIGQTKEYLELKVLETPISTISHIPPESSLTILWFESDDNEFIIDGKNYNFRKNQIVFYTEFHKVIATKKGKTKYLRFNRDFYCVIDHDNEISCKGLLFFGASQLPIITIPDSDLDHFKTLWKMFSIEMQLKDNLQIEMLQMMLKRYLILSTRLYKQQNQVTYEKRDLNIVREFNFLVEQHFRTKHTVEEYAKMLNKSPKTLSNIFLKDGDKSPLTYIKNRKMLESRRLLIHTDMQIKEIGDEIGYEDIQSFSRFFKKEEGISPSEFRKKSPQGKNG